MEIGKISLEEIDVKTEQVNRLSQILEDYKNQKELQLNQLMDRDIDNLEIAQMLKEHPIMDEKLPYKDKYLNVLEYFVRKYSADDIWANAVLRLYKEKILGDLQNYNYREREVFKQSKNVVATKFKPFRFFSYRYCLIFDCIFMNAIGDKGKGEKIYTELSSIYHKRYKKKIRQVFDALYDIRISLDGFEQINYMAECWKKNMEYQSQKLSKVLVTANMSAGKSTLLNAIVGKKINKTQNDACTAKNHYILNKAFEDELIYELDGLLDLRASKQVLMDDNEDNLSNYIAVGVRFRNIRDYRRRIWFIDTPGVNSSQDIVHKEISEHAIKECEYDTLLYVLNSQNIGTDDDRKHMEYVAQNYKGRTIFLINKLDTFRTKDDSVNETLECVKRDVKDIGFKNAIVYPISAYAAYLSKMHFYGEDLNEDEVDELEYFYRKMKKEEFNFEKYYPVEFDEYDNIISDKDKELMLHSGILSLEKVLMQGE